MAFEYGRLGRKGAAAGAVLLTGALLGYNAAPFRPILLYSPVICVTPCIWQGRLSEPGLLNAVAMSPSGPDGDNQPAWSCLSHRRDTTTLRVAHYPTLTGRLHR